MAYFRESHYTKKLLVGFTEDQRTALDKVSAREKRSLAGVVRDAVDRHIRAVGERERTKKRPPATTGDPKITQTETD